MKDLYSKLGLQYRESSSEDEDLAAKATEVIEIPDEDDDDVMSIDSGWKHSSVSHCTTWYRGEGWRPERVLEEDGNEGHQNKDIVKLAISPVGL